MLGVQPKDAWTGPVVMRQDSKTIPYSWILVPLIVGVTIIEIVRWLVYFRVL